MRLEDLANLRGGLSLRELGVDLPQLLQRWCLSYALSLHPGAQGEPTTAGPLVGGTVGGLGVQASACLMSDIVMRQRR